MDQRAIVKRGPPGYSHLGLCQNVNVKSAFSYPTSNELVSYGEIKNVDSMIVSTL